MQDFGVFKRLKDIREDCDLTQVELAKSLGVSTGTYSKWEKEIEIMPLRRVVDFANITRKKLDYIAGISNDSKNITCDIIINIPVIGNKLKIIRKSLGLTQIEFADILGSNQSSISSYELGKNLILSVYAVEICKLYNISLDWLINNK